MMNKNKIQEENLINSERSDTLHIAESGGDVIPKLRELLKEDISKILINLMEIISKTTLERIVNPELNRRFARDNLPLIIQILFKEIVKDELNVEFRFDDEATGKVITERKREDLSVKLIRRLLSETRMPRKILVDERNLVAYITWIRTECGGYMAYPQIDRLLPYLLDKPPKPCPECGRAFIAMRKDKVYCSKKCKYVASKRRQRKKI